MNTKTMRVRTRQRWATAMVAPALIWTVSLFLVPARTGHAWSGDVPQAIDEDGDPNNGIFVTTLTADEYLHDLGGNGDSDDFAEMFAFNESIPGPEIRVTVGDRVIVRLINELDDEEFALHWHGLELNNFSDGTQVTQNPIAANGGQYTYDFLVTRPGIFWYHPHLMPTDQTFRGLYGTFIVRDPAEDTLIAESVLPILEKTLVLSDITRCADVGPGDPIGIQNACAGQPPDSQFVPKVQPARLCRTTAPPTCQVREGKIMLSNGRVVDSNNANHMLEVPAGEGLRLRVVNCAITRYFRLVPPDDHVLFRVGGEGGLLEHVRLEGNGTIGPLDPGYEMGEILLAPADRADIVIVPQGPPGTVLTIQSDNAPPNNYVRGNGTNPNLIVGPVIQIKINDGPPAPEPGYTIDSGDPLLAHPEVGKELVNLGIIPVADLDVLVDPSRLSGQQPIPGSNNPSIEFQVADDPNDFPDAGTGPAIDGVRGMFDEAHAGDFILIPHVNSSRFAYTDDVLELSIENTTGSDHPFHLHGFSIQPIRMCDASIENVTSCYNYDYPEFLDNINIKPGHILTFRVHLEERPEFGETFFDGGGGAVGRWLFHCHIFHHAGLGMISELVVLRTRKIDLFVIVDTSGSLSLQIQKFKEQAEDIINTLVANSNDVRFGLATFADYPIAGFGAPGDTAYQRIIDLDDFDVSDPGDVTELLATINDLSIPGDPSGGDPANSQYTALYQAATGEGEIVPCCDGEADIPAGQQANFRDDALKVFLLWTDAPFHNPGDPGPDIPYPGKNLQQTLDAVQALGSAKVISVVASGGGYEDGLALALGTGALAPPGGLDCDGDGVVDIPEGAPLVCQISDDGVEIGQAITRLVMGGAVAVSTPVAKCKDVTVSICLAATATVDDGSFDPDGDPFTLELTPTGPYAIGTTPVTLRATDSTGLSDLCVANLTVVDTVVDTCPEQLALAIDSLCEALSNGPLPTTFQGLRDMLNGVINVIFIADPPPCDPVSCRASIIAALIL